ncbi:MAG: ABC-F family ATP-binding cassette domain-containing protein [Lachnospiraceae bacterium]
MLYQIQDGTISLGGEVILSHFDFEIRGREKIALVGRNGTGKTTLLRLLSGELDLDRDDKRMQPGIRSSRQITVGMLSQQVFDSEKDSDRTVEEELLFYCPVRDTWDRERFLYEQEYDRLFTGFGFRKADKKKKLSEFSGGQRTRIALIRLMLMKPDLLLLDEPTNHLDQDMLVWLEQWIKQYEKAVVMVSHDRFFLDETAEVVYEIENRTLRRYAGNYSAYVEEKQKNRRIQQKEWERQQAEVERLNELIKKFRNKPKKASFARSRQKILDRMQRIGKLDGEDVRPVFAGIQPETISARYVLEAEKLQIGYDHALLELGLRIRRGQKIGVIGPNGVGKSTFLKTAAGLIPPIKGKCILGERVVLQYFDQQTASINDDCSVLDHFRKQYPGLTDRDARSVLARWLFKGQDVAVKVGELSGGEKSRLMFAEIFQCCPNFMVLDEPTNHMDIPAKETLEAAFRAYEGTLLFVSHDRYFISQVADALLVFEPEQVIYYPFGYRHYLHRKKQAEAMESVRKQSKEDHIEPEEEMMGGKLLGMGMSAEDTALIDGFRKVPEAEKGRFRRISTEEAYQDWKRRLMEEDLERLENKAALLEDKLREAELRELYEESFSEGEEIRMLLEETLQQWTEMCIAWDEEVNDIQSEDCTLNI